MKIGILSSPHFPCPPQAYGGAELVNYNLACGLAEQGHKVILYAPDESRIPPKGFLFMTGKATRSVNVNWLEEERKMFNKCKHTFCDLDIVLGSNWFGMEYKAKAKNNDLKVCHVHHGHLNLRWWKRSPPPFKLNFIAISKWMQKVYRSQGFESRVCYNGIDLDRYPFSEDHGDRLLFVGRIDRFKQPHVAIEVAKKLDMGLDVVGGTFVQDPEYLEDVRRMCDGEQIRFYPDAPHEKKVELMQNAKALLFPSKMGEPFGLVACEAMACGCPAVALNDGAISEVVMEGGVVCDVYDTTFTEKGPVVKVKGDPVEAMVEAVEKVDSVKPEDCRKNAERFSRNVMARSYLELYKSILEGKEW